MRQPDWIINCNSRIGWDLLVESAQKLRARSQLGAMLFCDDQDQNGIMMGYGNSHFPHVAEELDLVVLDNLTYRDTLRNRYHHPSKSNAAVLKFPVSESLLDVGNRRLQTDAFTLDRPVVWLGRLCQQKDFVTAAAVARLLPEQKFQFYGWGTDLDVRALCHILPDNASFHGKGSALAIGLEQPSAFLNTSRWDGMPNVILEMGAMGVPIVTSLTGGIGELVSPATGWPVECGADPSAYASALTMLLESAAETRERAGRCYMQVRKNYSKAAFDLSVAKVFGESLKFSRVGQRGIEGN